MVSHHSVWLLFTRTSHPFKSVRSLVGLLDDSLDACVFESETNASGFVYVVNRDAYGRLSG